MKNFYKSFLVSLFSISCLAPAEATTNPPIPKPQCPSSVTSCLYNHQAANGTTTIKSGAGFLHTITVGTVGATDTITVYDNTAGSGTVIAVINDATSGTYTLDVGFITGLTIVIAGTTAPDVTVAYI